MPCENNLTSFYEGYIDVFIIKNYIKKIICTK